MNKMVLSLQQTEKLVNQGIFLFEKAFDLVLPCLWSDIRKTC